MSTLRTPGFEQCATCAALDYGTDDSNADKFRRHHTSEHVNAVPPDEWLTAETKVILHDRGFGSPDARSTIDGLRATVEVGYAPNSGLVVRTDAGALTWVHPSECEPSIVGWRSRRLIITGSRDWTDDQTLQAGLNEVLETLGHQDPVTLVSGACQTGADMLAERYWASLGWPVERHPANFAELGPRGAYLRNSLMTRLGAGSCAAFPIGSSKGTRMTMKLAQESGVPLFVREG